MSFRSSLRATSPSERRLVLTRFLFEMGNQGTYYLGIIGLTTYVLHADAWTVTMLTFIANTLVLMLPAAGVAVDRLGPRRVG